MNNLFLVLALISMLGIVLGLIKPSIFLPFGKRRTRLKSSSFYIVCTVVFSALFGVTAPSQPDTTHALGSNSPNGGGASSSQADSSASSSQAGNGALSSQASGKNVSANVVASKTGDGTPAPGTSANGSAPGASSAGKSTPGTSSGSVSASSAAASPNTAASPNAATASSVRADAPVGALVPVVVSKNTDGDTIHVRMPSGKDETIRMLLIDTPESVDPKLPIEPYGPQASAYAKKHLWVGEHIEIEEGKPGYTRDKYGRLLAFVYINPHDMYNEDVVRLGLARVAYIYPPNTRHLSALDRDQQYAESHHLNIWSIPGYATPHGYDLSVVNSSTRSASTTSSSASTAGSSSGSLHIIASNLNVSDGGEASVTVQTTPGATGSIDVEYKSGQSHAKGLAPETANSQGDITWVWKVGFSTAKGSWPVIVHSGSQKIETHVNVR